MYTLGIVLARAGSKGLTDKCVRPLLGRPLIEYTFDHLLAARRVDARLLTTDSRPAAQLALQRGIEIIDRPPELADDHATVDAAARHALKLFEIRRRKHVEAVVLLYGNVPIRGERLIDRAVELLQQTGCDSVRSVAPVGKHHPDWMFRLGQADSMQNYRPNSIHRRQDLEPLYELDGAVCVVRREALLAVEHTPEDRQSFLGRDRRAIVQAPGDAVDIDDAFDLLVAEARLMEQAQQAPFAAPHAARSGLTPVGARA